MINKNGVLYEFDVPAGELYHLQIEVSSQTEIKHVLPEDLHFYDINGAELGEETRSWIFNG